MNAATALLQTYQYPESQPRSTLYNVTVDGEKVDALCGDKADFAAFECSGPVKVTVEPIFPAAKVSIKPFSRGIQARAEEGSVHFQISHPQNLCIDVPGQKPLFLYVNGPEVNKPDPNDPRVRYFAAGQIHEVGQFELKSGETVYIEGGAVVRGNIISKNAKAVQIRGRGILDGSCYQIANDEYVRSIIFEHCSDIFVEDIIMIHPTSWMLVLACSESATIRNLRQIGSCMSSDGIDICGSSRVLIEDCCLRNDDDNIAIKSLTSAGHIPWEGNVEDVVVRRCVFLNGFPGNAMEIGYELCADYVRNVVFEDIDVIYAHGEGAVFSIHNGDRALIENIRWQNIRVEHYWDKLVDFRVVQSRYNKDAQRGSIRNVHLKDIHVVQSYFNPGCSISLIGGFEPDQPINDIHFENFRLNDHKAMNGDDLELHTRNASNIRFS